MSAEGYKNNNSVDFDPKTFASQTSSSILILILLDTSASIHTYADEMNRALEELFMGELKGSHRAADIMVKCVTFDETVVHKSGFRPIEHLDVNYLHVDTKKLGSYTALYQGTLEGMTAMIDYRKQLELTGVDVRSAVLIVTDGWDNKSKVGTDKKVTELIQELRQEESWINSFTITMLGVGNPVTFEGSCRAMGLDPTKCLITVQDTAKDMRAAIGAVSASVSQSTPATTANF